MSIKTVLFVVPGNQYFPSGIVRVFHYLPYFNVKGFQYYCLEYYSSFSQKLLRWLSVSIFHNNKYTDLLLRMLFHLVGYPIQLIRMVQILYFSRTYEVLFIQSTLFPIFFSKLLKFFYKKIIFDYDDAWYVFKEKRTIVSIHSADYVIAGSHVLYDFAKGHNQNVYLIPSCVPFERYNGCERDYNQPILRIGWIGGDYTLAQLSILIEPLKALLNEEYQIEFVIAGSTGMRSPLHDISGLNIRDISHYSDEEISAIAETIDIGVMPLFDDIQNRGKCGYKLLIYMASGMPVIASPVGEANYIIEDKVNGLFASSSDEWISSIKLLLNDANFRQQLGQNGIETVKQKYTVENNFSHLEDIVR